MDFVDPQSSVTVAGAIGPNGQEKSRLVSYKRAAEEIAKQMRDLQGSRSSAQDTRARQPPVNYEGGFFGTTPIGGGERVLGQGNGGYNNN